MWFIWELENFMKNKYFKIIAVIMIVSCLFSCKSNYNLSKSVECLGVNIPVEEGSDFDAAYKSNTNYLFQDDNLNLFISIEKFQYSTDIPEFKDMSSKFIDDLNKQREQEVIVNNEDAIILMDKDLKFSTDHDDGDYCFNALYKKCNDFYTIFVYGDYDSLFKNKEWISESLKNVSFS